MNRKIEKKSKRDGDSNKFSRCPDPIDIHVGSRIRLRRDELDITQSQLGEILGITFQQVQKYERGANRVSASRLFHLCEILDTKVEFFFDGLNTSSSKKPKIPRVKKKEDFTWLEGEHGDLMTHRETIDLVNTYYQVRDLKVRRNFQKVLKAFVST